MFWPFKRTEPAPLSPEDVRDRLIKAAASGNHGKLLAACRQYASQVVANLDLMRKPPKGMKTDEASLQPYIQCLGAVAECLARECGSPELWDALCGTPESNPLVQREAWFSELPQRSERLEHPVLIEEAKQFILRAKQLEGTAARLNEAYLNGRLGELLFHSGRVEQSISPWQEALRLCREFSDIEGQYVYLTNLVESYRYLGQIDESMRCGAQALALGDGHGRDCEPLRTQLQVMRRGEPLCRVVCSVNGKDVEIEDLVTEADGHYQFVFRRNRIPLQMASALVQQGNILASSGNLADAMEKYQAAMDVDPFDPDPVYQAGMCLLEMGLYAKAREAFEDVERLAPGWFRCRFDRWMAEQLESGEVSENDFRLVRLLDDSNLPPEEAKPIALKAVASRPGFAPFHLFLGDIHQKLGDSVSAIASYRSGLQCVTEPDVESRLLCALACALPVGSPESADLVRRATTLDGSLVGKAMTAFVKTT